MRRDLLALALTFEALREANNHHLQTCHLCKVAEHGHEACAVGADIHERTHEAHAELEAAYQLQAQRPH